ncbi:uncharacterized protein PG998_012292 [Apiospora kogelbergensis]|uniref:uncharacterized protein n=1 Tax=Apiospora kogelbergensis TaxID=1337665 RepID=UPI003130D95B
MGAVPNADDIMVFTAELDLIHKQRTGPSYASRLHTVLMSVGVFCSVVDTFISSHPEIAALVWGGVKLTMMVAANVASYYQPTSDLFMKLGRLCPLFADYQALYPGSIRLQGALANFHASIIRCCGHVIKTLRRPLHQQLFNSLLVSLEQEFKPDLDEIQQYSDSVMQEIQFAKAQADRQEQQLQVIERQEARRNRTLKNGVHDNGNNNSSTRCLPGTTYVYSNKTVENECTKPPAGFSKRKIGSGKTITTASVIQHVLRCKGPSSGPVSYYFVQSTGTRPSNSNEILNSILQQRLDSTHVPDQLEILLRQLDDLQDTVELLRHSISRSTSYIIIDGIDECQISDRRYHSLYRRHHRQKVEDGDLCVGDPDLVNEVKRALAGGAQGMFLWAHFQVEEIGFQPSDASIRAALDNLPKGLSEVFNRALRRIKEGTHLEEAQEVFRWVAAAKRPLSLAELREAIAIRDDQQFSEPARHCNDMKKISKWCENLVEVEEESEVVQFIHHSVQTFLLGNFTEPTLVAFHVDLDQATCKLGKACLTYLDFNDFERGHFHVISEIVSWGIDPDTENTSGISALESAAQSGHVRAIEKLLSYRPKVKFGDAPSVAASGGFLCIVDRLVKAGAYIDGRLNYGTAHAEAASAGHTRTVNALLRAGTDVNGVASMESPLTRAVQGGHLTVVDILLAARADPNAYMAGCNEYSLICATLLGRLDIVNSLLSAGADDVAKKIPAFFQTERSKTNNAEIYRRLLQHEVKLSKRPARSRTMLHAASELGRFEDVRTLLGAGIKADTVDEVGRTALHIAASTSYVEVVSELCQTGSSIVHATDRFGNTALHIAARDSRCGETLRVLCHTKIDKYAENLSGFTAMDSIPLSRGDKIDILTKAGY